MNYLDIILTVAVLYGSVTGFYKGLIKEVTGLLSIIIGVYIAINFSTLVEPYFEDYFKEYKTLIPIIAFAALFLSTFIAIKIVANVLDKITNALALGFISKTLGAIFGAFKMFLIVGFLFFLEQKLEIIPNEKKTEAKIYKPAMSIINKIKPKIISKKEKLKQLDKKIKEQKQRIKKSTQDSINSR